jgi:hypothetical protein
MSINQNANGLGNKFFQHYVKPFPDFFLEASLSDVHASVKVKDK